MPNPISKCEWPNCVSWIINLVKFVGEKKRNYILKKKKKLNVTKRNSRCSINTGSAEKVRTEVNQKPVYNTLVCRIKELKKNSNNTYLQT